MVQHFNVIGGIVDRQAEAVALQRDWFFQRQDKVQDQMIVLFFCTVDGGGVFLVDRRDALPEYLAHPQGGALIVTRRALGKSPVACLPIT